MVHRQLLNSLLIVPNKSDDDPTQSGGLPVEVEQPVAVGTVAETASHINGKNTASKIAQRDSLQLFRALYFTDRVDSLEECTVTAVSVVEPTSHCPILTCGSSLHIVASYPVRQASTRCCEPSDH